MNCIVDYIGVPYSQLDCYALVRKVSEEVFGRELPSFADYIRDAEQLMSQEAMSPRWRPVTKEEAVAGDIAALASSAGRERHVGIYLGGGNILHTSGAYGSLVQPERGLRLMGYIEINYYRFIG